MVPDAQVKLEDTNFAFQVCSLWRITFAVFALFICYYDARDHLARPDPPSGTSGQGTASAPRARVPEEFSGVPPLFYLYCWPAAYSVRLEHTQQSFRTSNSQPDDIIDMINDHHLVTNFLYYIV